jgi:hypothetical protein
VTPQQSTTLTPLLNTRRGITSTAAPTALTPQTAEVDARRERAHTRTAVAGREASGGEWDKGRTAQNFEGAFGPLGGVHFRVAAVAFVLLRQRRRASNATLPLEIARHRHVTPLHFPFVPMVAHITFGVLCESEVPRWLRADAVAAPPTRHAAGWRGRALPPFCVTERGAPAAQALPRC